MGKLAALLEDNVRLASENVSKAEAQWQRAAELFGVDSEQATFYLEFSARCQDRLVEHQKALSREVGCA